MAKARPSTKQVVKVAEFLRFGLVLVCLLASLDTHAAPPTGITYQAIGSGWNEAVGTTFTEDGQMFVWERGGRVWRMDGNTKSANPFLDISPEVGAYRDLGFLGFAVHPNFKNNGFVYLLYVVDRHHLVNCTEQPSGIGEPICGAEYSPTTDQYNSATIGRVTRYTAVKPAGDINFLNATTIDYDSRKVLIGETPMTGCPVLFYAHGTGSLAFGDDATLLASCGDVANFNFNDTGSASGTYWDEALNGTPQIIRPAENVGAYRAQLTTSLSGKIIRIDAMTGDGIPSNPLYNAAAPRSAASRLWVLGLRNAFRFSHVEGSGSHDPSQGNPGVLLIGDVGSYTWEEFNVSRTGDENFGWPYFEGIDVHGGYGITYNRDTPNPLFGVNGCTQQFFAFQDLIKQESLNPLSFKNPCDTSVDIPASVPTWIHHRPEIDWNHGPSDDARWSTFDESGNPIRYPIGENGVTGSPFQGSSSTGGIWYTGSDLPAAYRNSYFQADYGQGWIRNFGLNGNFKPISVSVFDAASGPVVHLSENPVDGGLYFVTWGGGVYRVIYNPGNNLPPVSVVSANTTYGTAPLTIQFSGTGSRDPEGLPLSYLWNFGDATETSTEASPSHTFNAVAGVPTSYTVSLQVADQGGLTHTATLPVSVNNTPPVVTILSPMDGTRYPLSQSTSYDVSALVSDAEQGSAPLACSIQLTLHHNDHVHSDPPVNACQANVLITPLGCGTESYYWRIAFAATDSAGLSGYDEVLLLPDCQDTALVANAGADQTVTAGSGNEAASVLLDGSASSDGSGGIVSYVWYKDGVKVATGANPSVSFEVGSHVVRLEVLNATGAQAADTSHVVVLSASGPTNQAPTINAIGNQSVTVGSALGFSVTGVDADGPAPLAMTISGSTPALPAGASYTDNGNATGSFAWTPNAANVGTYVVTFAATEAGAGLSAQQSITITVSGGGGSASLVGSAPTSTPSSNNLTVGGPVDWVHWGLTAATSVNRKANVALHISGITNLGTAPKRFGGNPANWWTHSWSGGTPTVSQAGFPGGTYFVGVGNGYTFTVPAGTTSRTLKVYVGGFASRSRIDVTLSDGSAAPYSTTFENMTGNYQRVVTINFSATSIGQTLTFRHTLDGGGGNIGLQAAALQGTTNQAPTINPIGNKLVTVGSALAFSVTAVDADGPAPLAMTISGSIPALPAGASYTDNGNGTGSFAWTPNAANVGTYVVTFAATEAGAGLSAQQSITITVSGGGGSASLVGSAPTSTPSSNNLTADGPADWVHWGLTAATSVNRKANVPLQISGITNLGAAPKRFGGNPANWWTHSWSGGTPTVSQAGFPGGTYFVGVGNGYTFTVPAGTTSRTLKVYVGGFASRSRIDVTLSDGSAAPYSTTFENLTGNYQRVVTITFSAASNGQTLTFRHTLDGGGGNIGLQAAAL